MTEMEITIGWVQVTQPDFKKAKEKVMYKKKEGVPEGLYM
jgi:26S proteasome regulatory subunit T2